MVLRSQLAAGNNNNIIITFSFSFFCPISWLAAKAIQQN